MKFMNRTEEIAYLKSYFAHEPNALLFVYGPKSSGKSVLLEKVINELDPQRFVVHFMDLRRMLVYDFKSFLDTFFMKDLKGKIQEVLQGITVNIPFVSINVNDESLLQKNPFKLIEKHLETLRNKGLQPIIILDEIQLLKPIYINSERYLLNELFNLFISLTKTRHLAHIVCATSESYFIEEIYNSAKLKKTVEFYLVDHLSQSSVSAWLTEEGLAPSEIDTVWHYIGGCPWEIQQILINRDRYGTIEDACLFFVNDEYGKLFDYAFRMEPHKENLLRIVIEKIVKDGYCRLDDIPEKETGAALLKDMAAHDFWFYKTDEQNIMANSQSIYRAFEKMVIQKA